MSAYLILAALLSGPKVTITDRTYTRATAAGSPAGVRFNPDGTKEGLSDDLGGGTWTQADGGTDWIVPQSATIGNDYEIRAEQESGDALDVSSDALDTWLALSSIRTWELSNSINKTIETANLRIRIRPVGGVEADNGLQILESENT